MNRKLVLASASTAILLILVFGVWFGLRAFGQKSAEGHITVTQANSQLATLQGQNIRIAGSVVPGSLSWESASGISGFKLSDAGGTIQVVYRGTMPSGFKPGGRLAVDGRLREDGFFEAADIPSNALCSVCHP